MSVKVYVVNDPLAINFLVDDDTDCFKEYLESVEFLDFAESEVFDSEAQPLAFCAALGYGVNESTTPERYPLCSF